MFKRFQFKREANPRLSSRWRCTAPKCSHERVLLQGKQGWYCVAHKCPIYDCLGSRTWCAAHHSGLAAPPRPSPGLSRWICTEAGCNQERLLHKDNTGWLCEDHKCPETNCMYRRGWCALHQGGLAQGSMEVKQDQVKTWETVVTPQVAQAPRTSLEKNQAENQRMAKLYPHPCRWSGTCESNPVSADLWLCEKHMCWYDESQPPGYIDKPRDESKAGAGPVVVPGDWGDILRMCTR